MAKETMNGMNWKGQTFTKAYDICQALLEIKTKSEAVEFCRVYASSVPIANKRFKVTVNVEEIV